jgi:23S rRNA (cytidine1920-2'-O)/16S rRNA (cytidine1409-2'-O)-methyltransferase
MSPRRRLDVELVRRGLARSREEARVAIAAGRVLVAGAVATKPARLVDAAEPVEVTGPGPRYVSRGGDKLAAALDAFGVGVAGRRCLDAGAATGGFTDCLLDRGAARVVAVDVGHGQLHPRLRADPRVVVRERTNVRHLRPDDVGGPFDLVVADLAFISLATVAPALVGLAAPGADLVLLVKPQFEAGRREAARGAGVIRDPVVWRRVLERVRGAFAARDAAMIGVMVSPLVGPAGNVEFFVHLRAPGGEPARTVEDGAVDAAIEAAVVTAARKVGLAR